MRRKDFRVFDRYTYLLTQGGGPLPAPLITEATRLLTELSFKGAEVCAEWDAEVAATRQALAASMGAGADNVAFIPSTSYAMSALAETLNSRWRVLTF